MKSNEHKQVREGLNEFKMFKECLTFKTGLKSPNTNGVIEPGFGRLRNIASTLLIPHYIREFYSSRFCYLGGRWEWAEIFKLFGINLDNYNN